MVTMEFDMCRADPDFVDYMTEEEIAERNAYIKECRLYLFSTLGAHVIDGYLKYWRIVKNEIVEAQQDICAFLKRRYSFARGIHKAISMKSGRWY